MKVERFHLTKPSTVKIYAKSVFEESNMSMDHWWIHNDTGKQTTKFFVHHKSPMDWHGKKLIFNY
jgi:hypothetical protein